MKPIEDRIAELDDVKNNETHGSGRCRLIAMEFEADTDADKKNDAGRARSERGLGRRCRRIVTELEIRKGARGS